LFAANGLRSVVCGVMPPKEIFAMVKRDHVLAPL
jgi:hypothetical protein